MLAQDALQRACVCRTAVSFCRLHCCQLVQAALQRGYAGRTFEVQTALSVFLGSAGCTSVVQSARLQRSKRCSTPSISKTGNYQKRETLTGFANAAAKKVLLEIDADAEVLVPTRALLRGLGPRFIVRLRPKVRLRFRLNVFARSELSRRSPRIRIRIGIGAA